jgi:hypothetical protein
MQEAVRRQYNIHPDEELVVSFQSCEPPLPAAAAPPNSAHPMNPMLHRKMQQYMQTCLAQDMCTAGAGTEVGLRFFQLLTSRNKARQLSALQGKGVQWASTVGRHTTQSCCLPRYFTGFISQRRLLHECT